MQIIYFQIPFKIQLRPLKSLSTLHISGKFFSELLTQDTRSDLRKSSGHPAKSEFLAKTF
jgi:hypothetical protein